MAGQALTQFSTHDSPSPSLRRRFRPQREGLRRREDGIDAAVVDGKGKADWHPVELSVVVVHAPGDHFLTILGIEDAEHEREHDAELEKFVQSISPTS